MNKEKLIKAGFRFEKIEDGEYLDLSKSSEEILKKSEFDFAIFMRNQFLEESIIRGKALSILIPLAKEEDITELLSELYDLRESNRQRRHKDINVTKSNDEPCRPIKSQEKEKPQKKKVGKKTN